MKKRKIMTITAIALIIVIVAGAVIWKMLGIRAEGESTQIDTSKWDTENRVNIVYDTEGVPVPVPKGYTASSLDDEHTVNTGFVIYEGEEAVTEENKDSAQRERNQWVWVPVTNVSDIYYISNGLKRGRMRYYTSYYSEPGIVSSDVSDYLSCYLAEENQIDLNDELQREFESTLNSIERYGGFYIGRYECSKPNYNNGKLKTVRMVYPLQNSWYTIYRDSKTIKENENKNVITNMIWGCLWDHTLNWFITSGNKTYNEIINSTSWGNYENVTFEYKDLSGNIVTKDRWKSIPTGSTEYTKANNIYDMAGNVWEWTLSGYFRDRTLRGGTYYDYEGRKGSVRSYWNYWPAYSAGGQSAGSRAMLYIK